MSAVPMPQPAKYPQGHVEERGEREYADWMRVGAGGTLLAGSLLLLTGKRRAGLLVTAAGTALVLLQEQEMVRSWWNELPGYLEDAQRMLDQAQMTVDDLTSKRDKLMALFKR